MYNPFTLEGKTILITGASSGIGRRTAIECAKMKATLIITGRNSERLQQTYRELEGEGHQWFVADLTNHQEIKDLVSACSMLNGVFLCAGVTDTTPIKFMTAEKINRVLDINLISPMLLLKELLFQKKLQKGASLVFMSSMGATQVAPGLGIYAASKRGLNAVMHTVALELAARKIRANSIMPSMVKTELLDTLSSLSQEDLAKDEARYPLGYGQPEDIAYAAIYLLSDASRWITGTELHMDGGSTL